MGQLSQLSPMPAFPRCRVLVVVLLFVVLSPLSLYFLRTSPPSPDCSCANTDYRILNLGESHQPQKTNVIRGLNSSAVCCVLPDTCNTNLGSVHGVSLVGDWAPPTTGILGLLASLFTGHSFYRHLFSPWRYPRQVWLVTGSERPESGTRLFSRQDLLDAFEVHYTSIPMADSDFPVELSLPNGFKAWGDARVCPIDVNRTNKVRWL